MQSDGAIRPGISSYGPKPHTWAGARDPDSGGPTPIRAHIRTLHKIWTQNIEGPVPGPFSPSENRPDPHKVAELHFFFVDMEWQNCIFFLYPSIIDKWKKKRDSDYLEKKT